ncbi:hypothetical protein ABZY31_01355 [Streptomyces sp. NPDC006529]|uniref:hypothetical protein n=1 Tax=Streptomyces sp. NPDC006529 TaxID=3157177 RepID=UPI0033A134C7
MTAVTLTGCGGPPRDGYVAVGAAAPGPERGAGEIVAPRSAVEYQSLADPSAAGTATRSTSTSPSAPGNPATDGSGAGGAVPGAPTGFASASGSTPPGGPGTSPTTPAPNPRGSAPASGGSGSSPGTGSSGGTGGSGGNDGTGGTGAPTPPASTPARLVLGAPARSAAADRWCERVGVTFTNTGSTAARSGTVTFSTHIIGALGIDWATITSAQPLPAPIAGGSAKTQTYTVCVESWRVPLGMHVDTQRVTATWN